MKAAYESGKTATMKEPARPPRRTWMVATALAVGLFTTYTMNGREIGAGDTMGALFLPVSILRGDGPRLDRFRFLWPAGILPYFVVERHGTLVSRYPIGASLLAAPFTAPQLFVLDRRYPGWDRDRHAAVYWARKLGKASAAAMAALTGAVLYLLLSSLQLGAAALPATLIAALGSNLWMTASQSLWQHGPAALSLTVALALLTPPPRGRLRLLLAGAACAAIVYCRPTDLVAPLLISLWVVGRYRRAAVWFGGLPIALGAVLIGYNLWYFDRVSGGYGELVDMDPVVHGIDSFWSASPLGNALGTLISPSHGLFIFTPWIPLALAAVPAIVRRMARWPLIAIVLWTLPLFLLQLSLQGTWWAGWSFGPRYWTDVMPLFAILLGFALDWARRRSRVYLIALIGTGLIGIAVQAIGAWCYPSSWNGSPANVDTHHERLWDWRDTELTRCLHDGTHPPE